MESVRIVTADLGISAIIAIVSIVISTALSVAQMLLAPKPKPPKLPDLGSQGQTITQRQPIGYWRFIYGETRVGLHPVYMTATESNDKFHIVGVVACHEVNRFGTVYVKDRPVFTGDLAADGVPTIGAFVNSSHAFKYLRIKTKLGTDDQTAFDDLVAESGGEWTADHRCRGHALLYTRHTFQSEIYASGLPNVSAVVQGKKVYDPRDGGTRWSPNPALCIRDYLLTSAANGGFGAVAAEIDDSHWSAAANICDEFVASPTTGAAAVSHQVIGVSASGDHLDLDGDRLKLQTGDRVEASSTGTLPAGLVAATAYYTIVEQEQKDDGDQSQDVRYPRVKLATSYANALARTAINITDAGTGTHTLTKTGEPRYTLNGAFTTEQAPRKILEDMLSCCGARLVYTGGKFRLMGLAWEAPTLTLDEDDVRGGGIKVQTKRARRDRFNAIKGTFLSPLNDWQPTDWPPITVAAYETQDNGVRIFNEFDQPFTSRSGQAQRVGKLMLARNRFERVVNLPAKLTAYDCKAGEIIAVTNSRWGWSAKPFEVLNRKPVIVASEKGNYLGIDLVLNEARSTAFDWSSSEEQSDAPAIPPTLPDWTDIPAPGAPAVTESLYEGRDGSDVKARVTLVWAASTTGLLDGYEVEFKLSAAGDSGWRAFGAGGTPAEITTIEHSDIDPGTYDFRVRARTAVGARSDWSTTFNTVVFGLSADPVAITGLSLQRLGGQAILNWDLHADADVRRGGWIEFRHSPAASGAVVAESTSIASDDGLVLGRDTMARLPLKAGTYFARAVDKLGNPGPWASVASDGATILTFSALGSIVEHSAFPGTHSGTLVSGAGIKLDGATNIDSWGDVDSVLDWDSEGGVASSGTYTFSAYLDSGTTTGKRLRGHIKAQVFAARGTIDSRTANMDTWESFDGASEPGAADAWIEFRETADDPAGTPTWSEWMRLDVTEITKRYVQLRCQVRSYDPAFNILVTELAAYFESGAI